MHSRRIDKENLHNNLQNFSSQQNELDGEIDKVIKEDERALLPHVNNPILYSEFASSDKPNKAPNVVKTQSAEFSSEVLSKDVCFGTTIYRKQIFNNDDFSGNSIQKTASFLENGKYKSLFF